MSTKAWGWVVIVMVLNCGCDRSVTEDKSKTDSTGQEIVQLKMQIESLGVEVKRLKEENWQLNRKRDEIINRLSSFFREKRTGLYDCPDADYLVFSERIEPPTVQAVISAFNKRYERPQLVLKEVKANTAYLGVEDDAFLTQQMGSAGAQCFLGMAVFSLTSVKGIDFVHFDFEEGDHAAPGRYSRLDFISLWPIMR